MIFSANAEERKSAQSSGVMALVRAIVNNDRSEVAKLLTLGTPARVLHGKVQRRWAALGVQSNIGAHCATVHPTLLHRNTIRS